MAFRESKTYEAFAKKIYLSSPTMHGEELKYMQEAYETNWMSTVGANINESERLICELIGCRNAVGLSCGTAALHMAVKLAAERLYGRAEVGSGSLKGHKVFCTDMTFFASLNPVVYEGGEPVFIDTEYDTWNMDPVALRAAFERFPEVKLVVLANLYGVPAKLEEISAICKEHGALLVEDAAESMGATCGGVQTGLFGDYGVLSCNGNKIITGSAGGFLITDDDEGAAKVRKWSTQSRENAPWYQHEEIGYNYRMSNVIAGVIRGQIPYLYQHIEQKKAIYERYKEGLKGLPVSMNPFDETRCTSNYWLSCLLIHEEGMCRQTRSETEASYAKENGKSCPTEILEVLAGVNAEGRPIWKPMHLQPLFQSFSFVTADGTVHTGREDEDSRISVGGDIFERGLCLPSDNKMTPEEQDVIIELIRACFGGDICTNE